MLSAVPLPPKKRIRHVIYVSDPDGDLLPWLESVAEDQRRRHPGRTATVASVAKEALVLARRAPGVDEQLRR